MCNRVCYYLVHLSSNKKQSYWKRGRHRLVACVAVSCWQQSRMGTGLRAATAGLAFLVCVMAEGHIHPGHVHFWAGRCLRQDKHLVRWTFCCNCPPFSQALCQWGEKQIFRQGYKMALLKVPEGWSNTNFTESHLKVSETWAFKSF